MSAFEWVALGGLASAAMAMLTITQTKERVTWPAWLLPATIVLPVAGLTAYSITQQGSTAFWPLYTESWWGMQLWFDRLVTVTIAFFLIQNRARAAGMKSEIWVLLTIFTGSLGLLLMVAQMTYLERRQSLRSPAQRE
jgi:hypothetical protein